MRKQLKELHLLTAEMRKIALPEEGIETLYGAHDANLKHIESLLNVDIRTQGAELTVEGDPADEQRAQLIFDQLRTLMDEGYTLANGDVKTAAQLLVENADLDLRDYFLKGGQRQGDPPPRQSEERQPAQVSRRHRAVRHRVRRRSRGHRQDLPGDGAGRQLSASPRR